MTAPTTGVFSCDRVRGDNFFSNPLKVGLYYLQLPETIPYRQESNIDGVGWYGACQQSDSGHVRGSV